MSSAKKTADKAADVEEPTQDTLDAPEGDETPEDQPEAGPEADAPSEGDSNAQRVKVGTLVRADHIVNPHGVEHDIVGGIFVIDAPGIFVIDGREFEAF